MTRKEDRNKEIARRIRDDTDVSLREIAQEYGLSAERIRQIGKAEGVVRGGARSGRAHPHWKGDEIQDADGRTYVWAPDHTRARSGGRVAKDILVAEEKLGRLLKDHEVVWHLDRDLGNDDPDNLEVISRGEKQSRLGRSTRKYSQELLIRLLRYLALEVGHTPTLSEINEKSPVYHHYYYTYFESLKDACQLAGLKPNKVGGGGAEPLTEEFVERHGHLLEEFDNAQEVFESTT